MLRFDDNSRLAWSLKGDWHRRAQRILCRLGWHITDAYWSPSWPGCCTFCGKKTSDAI